jgi:hypothetical protein
MNFDAKKMLLIGFILLVLGVVLPFLMVLDIIKTSFLLSFLSHAASVSGLLLGTLGAFSYVRIKKR